MSADRVFFDTNILVYAYDPAAEGKWRTARGIVEKRWATQDAVVSTQVLQEFYWVVTTRIPTVLSRDTARTLVTDYLKWNVIVNDGQSILNAIDIQERHRYSFWDALIIESAIRGGASLILSEDLHDGQTIDGVKIENPFK